MVNKKALIAELNRRKAKAAEEAAKPKFTIENYCFPEQVDFIFDKSKFKTA